MAFTSAANTGPTEMDFISSIVQEELIRSAKLRPTVTDYSSMADKGIKSIDIPRFDTHFANPVVQNPDGETPAAESTLAFDVDTIDLNDWTNLHYRIPDRVSQQTRINLEAELAASAGKTYGNYLDDQIIAQLRLAADGTGGLPDHRIQLSGGTNDEITLADITTARMLLNKANVSENDRFLLVSPEQEKAMLDLDNFVRANEYGSREALIEGEIGRVYGMRVIVHNGLNPAEAIAYQKGACGIAVQQEVKFESRRSDLALQRTEYSFAMGMGQTVLEQGVKQVLLNSTGA